MSRNRPLPLLGWFDLEATGSDDPEDDYILEVALVVTDHAFKEIASFDTVVDPGPSSQWMQRLERNAVVSKMHINNGLVNDLLSGKGIFPGDAERQLIATLARHGRPGQFKLAGSGVAGFDRTWLQAQMPNFETWFRKPTLDTAPMRAMIRDVAGRGDLLQSPPDKAHRALADVYTAMNEAKHYRDLLQQISAA